VIGCRGLRMMAYGACANDMRSSRDALAKSRFPGGGKGLIRFLGGLVSILFQCFAQASMFFQVSGCRRTARSGGERR
jgi:hypothetical protein